MKNQLKAAQAKIAALANTKAVLTPEQAAELEGLLAEVKSLKLQIEAQDMVAQAEAERVAEIKAAAVEEYKKAQGPDNDPTFEVKGFHQTRYGDIATYDNYSIPDLALASELTKAAHGSRNPKVVKAMAVRLEQDTDEVKADKPLFGGPSTLKVARAGLRSAGILKANEADYSTNAGYGDEWIGVGYSGSLWDVIRANTFVVDKLNPFEFPAGVESLVIPLSSTDPIWYLVAQSGDPSTSTTRTTPVVPASGMATSSVTMTLAKLGSGTNYSGEMVEDSVLPFVNQLRTQIAISGAEYLESAVIDGDNATATVTNINDIAGTPAGTEWFMVWDGFRVSALVTTSANSRSGGVLTSSDFLETVKLMGTAGINGLDRSKVSFIVDPWVHYKALELDDVKTRDVFNGATIEGGRLTGLYGYGIDVSGQICKASTARLSNSAGKVDVDTTTNNTYGSIVAVRWDQWQFAFRRRMTMEVERIPRADAWEITTLMRAGLIQRDTEASAVTYGVSV